MTISVDEHRHIRLGHLTLSVYLASTQDLSIFSIRYRGAALWNNTLANGHSIVNASCNVRFLNFNFYATSISTTDFSDHDYVYC